MKIKNISSSIFFSLLFSPLALASFSAVPTNPNLVKPEHFNVEVAPGSSFTEQITITNRSESPQSFIIYPVYQLPEQADGTIGFSTSAQDLKDFALFAETEISETTLEPDESKTIDIIFNIPADTEEQILQGGISVQSLSSSTQGALSFSVRKVIRSTLNITNTPNPPEKMPKTEIEVQNEGINIVAIYFYSSIAVTVIFFGYALYHFWPRKKQSN